MALAGTFTRLEKAALDSGFDRELPRVGEWLVYASTHSPLEVWVSAASGGQLVAALSRADVADALTDHGTLTNAALPAGAASARVVGDIPALGRLLRRAYQLARTLPNGLLHDFQRRTASMQRGTEAERLVVQRIGQDVFRDGLLEYWEGRCAITGLTVTELLRASHIKPWADCETDAERLDVFNGLLLAPNLDAAFDRGFVTVLDSGQLAASEKLADEARAVLGIQAGLRVARLTDAHRRYLAHHRAHVFKR